MVLALSKMSFFRDDVHSSVKRRGAVPAPREDCIQMMANVGITDFACEYSQVLAQRHDAYQLHQKWRKVNLKRCQPRRVLLDNHSFSSTPKLGKHIFYPKVIVFERLQSFISDGSCSYRRPPSHPFMTVCICASISVLCVCWPRGTCSNGCLFCA